jgi:hypothetical protein
MIHKLKQILVFLYKYKCYLFDKPKMVKYHVKMTMRKLDILYVYYSKKDTFIL